MKAPDTHESDSLVQKEQIAAEIIQQVESLFFDLSCCSARILKAIDEIGKNIGNLRFAFQYCDELLNNMDSINLPKADKTRMREIIIKLKLALNGTYSSVIGNIDRQLNTGTAFKILERIEASFNEINNSPANHSWVHSINSCLNAPADDCNKIKLDGLKLNFNSLVNQIAKGCIPAEKDFTKLNELLEEKREELGSLVNQLELCFIGAVAAYPSVEENMARYFVSKIIDIRGYIGGYFSVIREPSENIPKDYRQITNRTEGFVKSMIDLLAAIEKINAAP